jgi:C4-dicarboxylate-specific signal transduction histidine kinase
MVSNGDACLRWLSADAPDLDEVRLGVNQMVADATRAAEVIRRLRSLARKVDPDHSPLAINDVVLETIPLVTPALNSHHVELKLELSDALPEVAGDRVQLQQVVINLIANAMQAMSQDRRTQSRVVVKSTPDLAGGVLLSVSDNGPGIPADDMNRLFSTFYTTKPDGMGMGLAICRSIVEAHGGTIVADRNESGGASFEIRLPPLRHDDR